MVMMFPGVVSKGPAVAPDNGWASFCSALTTPGLLQVKGVAGFERKPLATTLLGCPSQSITA